MDPGQLQPQIKREGHALDEKEPPKVHVRQGSNAKLQVLSIAYPMEGTQNQKRSLSKILSILISC